MRIKRFIGELCVLEHRASCSKNEQRAAKHIFELMGSLGLKTIIDEFKSQKSMTGELVTILLFFIAAITCSFTISWLCLLLSISGLILFWGYFSNRFKPIALIFRHSISYNVIGKFPNNSAPNKIIFTAHHDTARSSLLWNPKMVANFRSSFLTGAVILIILEILLILKFFKITSIVVDVLVIAAGIYILGQIFILLHGRITGKLVQGANDNASGVAAMLDLAAKLKNGSFPQFEFWFVSTGSEEVGAIGMDNFLKTYRDDFEKKSTYFINFDNIGKGELHYYLGEGMLNFYRFSDSLISAAHKAAAKKEFKNITPKKFRVAYTDAIIPASRGYHAMLLLSTNEQHIIPNWHWETDIMDNLDFDLIQKASDFTFELIKNLNDDLIKKTKEKEEK